MMSKEIYVVERQKDKSGWLVILACAALLVLWKLILVVCVIAAVSWIIVKAKRAADERRERRISRDAAIALRAEQENQLALLGDPLGIYGRYTPPTMPMTWPPMADATKAYNNYIDRLDDYNDGLGW